jgi:hypothetical protein
VAVKIFKAGWEITPAVQALKTRIFRRETRKLATQVKVGGWMEVQLQIQFTMSYH